MTMSEKWWWDGDRLVKKREDFEGDSPAKIGYTSGQKRSLVVIELANRSSLLMEEKWKEEKKKVTLYGVVTANFLYPFSSPPSCFSLLSFFTFNVLSSPSSFFLALLFSFSLIPFYYFFFRARGGGSIKNFRDSPRGSRYLPYPWLTWNPKSSSKPPPYNRSALFTTS